MPRHGDLKVWWIAQMPGKAFEVMLGNTSDTANLVTARLLCVTLARYDDFQYQNRIKPDYANAGGLQVFDAHDGEWVDWYDSEGRAFDEIPEDELRSARWESVSLPG